MDSMLLQNYSKEKRDLLGFTDWKTNSALPFLTKPYRYALQSQFAAIGRTQNSLAASLSFIPASAAAPCFCRRRAGLCLNAWRGACGLGLLLHRQRRGTEAPKRDISDGNLAALDKATITQQRRSYHSGNDGIFELKGSEEERVERSRRGNCTAYFFWNKCVEKGNWSFKLWVAVGDQQSSLQYCSFLLQREVEHLL
ncbi:uncharacterized protein LOC130979324 [Arachis stenosperma]|uniref:uncharacterized protein LOC130979324 n=1 Tax=Arachis stenosperma TaxID=217475 RepID=UPI0025AD335B|nr:uncharacterized protein LOC130979324 [Arachis stenosperma]